MGKDHFRGKTHSATTRKKMSLHHADFRGDKNPYKKSLKDPAKREAARQRGRDMWRAMSLTERTERGVLTRTGAGEVTGTFWARVKSNAKARGKELFITPEYASKVFEQQGRRCILSGLELVIGPDSKTTTASLDRIDSTSGYIRGNVCWVHKTINLMKGGLTVGSFIEWCKEVANFSEENYGVEISPFVE